MNDSSQRIFRIDRQGWVVVAALGTKKQAILSMRQRRNPHPLFGVFFLLLPVLLPILGLCRGESVLQPAFPQAAAGTRTLPEKKTHSLAKSPAGLPLLFIGGRNSLGLRRSNQESSNSHARPSLSSLLGRFMTSPFSSPSPRDNLTVGSDAESAKSTTNLNSQSVPKTGDLQASRSTKQTQVLARLEAMQAELSKLSSTRQKSTPSSGPDHLIVLAHGLAGTSQDLDYLKRKLLAMGPGAVHVHSAKSNEDRTRDGVQAGGERLAREVMSVASVIPSLRKISFVGNSLGGLYSRYACAALEAIDGSGLIAGLEADSFVTTATPHIGIRSFTYVPIPAPLRPLAILFVGQTGDDLFLAEGGGFDGEEPLLEQMSTKVEFLKALRNFKRRRAYANLGGDFLVPFGTAAFEVSSANQGWGLFEGGLAKSFRDRATPLRSGCQVACELTVAGKQGVGAEGEVKFVPDEEGGKERRMAMSLDACGWSKVGVDFGVGLPLAHNKICALEGEGLLRSPVNWMWREGRDVVDHVASYLVKNGTW